MSRLILAAVLGLFTALANAAGIKVGEPIPPLTIKERGELILENDTITMQPWSTEQLSDGRVRVVQYLAGTMSAKDINKPFTDALDAADFSFEDHQTTTIVNLDAAFWGTTGLVMSKLEDKKHEHAKTEMVADANGKGLRKWGLEEDSSAIAILDGKGKVLFFHDGALSDEQIDRVLKLMRKHIQ